MADPSSSRHGKWGLTKSANSGIRRSRSSRDAVSAQTIVIRPRNLAEKEENRHEAIQQADVNYLEFWDCDAGAVAGAEQTRGRSGLRARDGDEHAAADSGSGERGTEWPVERRHHRRRS